MITFIKISFFSFTIWLTAGFINGLLFAGIFSLGGLIREQAAEITGLAIVFSLVFSVPAAFFLWLVFIKCSGNKNLPLILLKASLVLSLLSCSFISLLPVGVYKGHWILLSVLIVSSSLISVLLHHSLIRSINRSQYV